MTHHLSANHIRHIHQLSALEQRILTMLYLDRPKSSVKEVMQLFDVSEKTIQEVVARALLKLDKIQPEEPPIIHN